MAAARSAFTTWCRKIRTIELLKKARCISVGVASYCTGSTNNIEFLKANVVTNRPNVCFMKTNFPRSSTSFPHFENYQNTNLELVKPIRNLNTRWISTTVPHLNGKTSKTSSGKSKLKDRIEKVKEMVHVSRHSIHISLFILTKCAITQSFAYDQESPWWIKNRGRSRGSVCRINYVHPHPRTDDFCLTCLLNESEVDCKRVPFSCLNQ